MLEQKTCRLTNEMKNWMRNTFSLARAGKQQRSTCASQITVRGTAAARSAPHAIARRDGREGTQRIFPLLPSSLHWLEDIATYSSLLVLYQNITGSCTRSTCAFENYSTPPCQSQARRQQRRLRTHLPARIHHQEASLGLHIVSKAGSLPLQGQHRASAEQQLHCSLKAGPKSRWPTRTKKLF